MAEFNFYCLFINYFLYYLSLISRVYREFKVSQDIRKNFFKNSVDISGKK